MLESESPPDASSGPEREAERPQSLTVDEIENEEIRKQMVRIPEPMKQPLWRYITDLNHQEWKENKEARFLQAADEGRRKLGQPPIDPSASRRIEAAGRPREEPEKAYRQIQTKYEIALTDSPEKIRLQSESAYGDPEASSLAGRARAWPARERPKITAEQAEKRMLALEVDVTDLLAFLDSRTEHKNDRLIDAFLKLGSLKGELENTEGRDRRIIKLEISDTKRNIIGQSQEKDKLHVWRDILDGLNLGEIDEKTASRETKQRMTELQKFYQHISKSGHDQEALIEEVREDILAVIAERETRGETKDEQPEGGTERPTGVALPPAPTEEQPAPTEEPPAPREYEEGDQVTWVDEKGKVHTSKVKPPKKPESDNDNPAIRIID